MGVPAIFSSASCSLKVLMRLLVILLFSQPSRALRQPSILNLASMHINTAKSQLKGTGNAAAMLADVCRAELPVLQEDLKRSQMQVVDHPGDARRKLVAVESHIENCFKNMGEDRSSEAYNLLTKIGQSVLTAENLIDQSGTPAEDLTQNFLDDDGGTHEPDSEISAAMADKDQDDSQRSPSNGVRDGKNRQSRPFGSLSSLPLPPSDTLLMENMIVDYCPDHVDLRGSSATIRLDKRCGGKFHTQTKYSSGVFTVRMHAPSGAPGVTNSFFISSNDEDADMISFDLIGNLPNRVLTAYAANGAHTGTLETFHMDFDTSLHFHDYTIKWDREKIIWVVDNLVLRTLKSSRVLSYPTKPGHVFGYSWDASYVAGGNWAGRVNWDDGPFLMHYCDLQVTSPLSPGQWQPPTQPRVRKNIKHPLSPVVIDYCPSNTAIHDQDSSLTIEFDKFGCGSRIRSLNSYTSGKFNANVKCPDGDTSGLLTSMYLSSGEGSRAQDEIDFEFLGDNKRIVQTNFYVNGTGGHEQWVELDFDCSHDFHSYSIHYNKHHIQWFVDSRLVRTVLQSQRIEQLKPYPVKRVFLYASVWNASTVMDGQWTGKWHGADLPFVAKYSDFTIQYP